MLVPLLAYVGMTVVAPALNGATGRGGFWDHAAITMAVSGLATLIWFELRRVWGRKPH